MVRLLFNMRQPELLAQSAHLPSSTSTKYKTSSRKDLHAGDEVDFTAAQIDGVLTITKIQKK